MIRKSCEEIVYVKNEMKQLNKKKDEEKTSKLSFSLFPLFLSLFRRNEPIKNHTYDDGRIQE